MNFNKTAVATFVGAALTSMTLGAVAGPMNNSVVPAKILAAKTLSSTKSATTKSGMRNEFDAQLGKTTFQWAGLKQATPDMGAIAPKYQNAYAADFYLNKLTGLSAKKSTIIKPVLSSIHDLGRGARIAKYKQEIAGVEVFNREFNVMMDRNFGLVASSGYFVDKKATTSAIALLKGLSFGDAAKAITTAFAALGGNETSVELSSKGENGKFEQFSVRKSQGDYQLVGEPRAKKVFYENKGRFTPVYYVEIETSTADSVDSDLYGYVIDVKTGKVLFKNNLKSHAENFNYRVYADDNGKPWDSPHGNVIPAAPGSDPAAYLTAEYLEAPLVSLSTGPISTEDPWLADDATETVGNNVTAYVDAIAPQGLTNGDYTADITATSTFDYAYDPSQAEYSVNNRKAAIVNLFFLNNYLHDDFYDHGFDEVAGNAQAVNYGRGGIEGDALNVEVQDNSGFNNANMSTPSDGYSPRMQMYLFDKSTAANGVDWGLTVTSGADLGLLDTTRVSGFGPKTFAEFSGKLVRIDDGTDTVTDGCEAATNDAMLAGNIAVIDRGACAFVDKVRNAQAAGAIAVIVANNKDGDDSFTMGGTADDVTIPNVMVSQNEGAALYTAMLANDVVVSMFSNETTRSFKGSSWDSGIVAHEWAHYISNRLVGNSTGLSNNQGGSMGEGWGDFHALLLLSSADDALIAGNEMFGTAYSATSYVASFTQGIRRVAYSTDMEIDPLTFKDIEISAEVHDSGEIWASMLWDSYVGLINDDRHTFAQAQSLMKDYLVAGYKMTPVAPTYTEARDAILSAAYANDIEDYKVILAAFARRGMGLGAQSPSRFSTDHLGVVESYETDVATFNVTKHDLNTNYEGLTTGYCSNDNILDKGETATVGFTIQNGGNSALSGVVGKVEVVSGQDVTFANDGMVTFADVAMFGSASSNSIEFTLNEAATADNLAFKVSFPDLDPAIKTLDYSFNTTVNMDFTTRELVGTSQYNDMNTPAVMNDFSENVMAGGDMAQGTFSQQNWSADDLYAYGVNNSFTSDVAFETKTMTVGFNGNFSINFWHFYDLEAKWDGGVVEVSVNGGDWADVTDMGASFVGDGYIDTMFDYTEAAIAGRSAFTGKNWGWETVDFGEALNGNQVKFRFRIASDSAVSADGWYIDDLTFSNIQTSIFSDVVAGDSFACDNRLPTVTVGNDIEVTAGGSVSLMADAVDANGDALTYAWAQISGTTATLTGADTATLSFTAPTAPSGSDTLVFEVTVNDGTGSVVKSKSVNVTNPPVIVTPPKSSNSGGSTGLLALLLLPLAMLRRRKQG
jgi:fungalysin metallopeptidase (M36)/PA domain-containing protein/K319-like protein